MKIDIFEPISFCFGVEKSIETIKKYVNSHKHEKVFCLGHPVHNELVSNQLKKLNINIIDVQPSCYEEEISKLPSASTIIFSAHGHDKKIERLCLEKNMIIIDTICPIVENIQNQINEFLSKNKNVVYIGKNNHPESYAVLKNSHLVNFWDISSSFLVDFNIENAIVFNQTTLLKNKLEPIYANLLNKDSSITIKNTSCKFVNDRYEKLIKLNPNDYDYILIAGSTSSSNTLELLNKAEEIFGTKKALLVSKAEDLVSISNLKHSKSIAIFSGTSTPIELINDIKQILTQL